MEEQRATDPVGRCPYCSAEIVPELRPFERSEAATGDYLTGVVVCSECDAILGATESREPLSPPEEENGPK